MCAGTDGFYICRNTQVAHAEAEKKQKNINITASFLEIYQARFFVAVAAAVCCCMWLAVEMLPTHACHLVYFRSI